MQLARHDAIVGDGIALFELGLYVLPALVELSLTRGIIPWHALATAGIVYEVARGIYSKARNLEAARSGVS